MKYLFPALFMTMASLNVTVEAKDAGTSLEESLELRKISEYWKEKDYHTVKIQIRNFLSKNPKSVYVDQLYAMLGDLYFQEKNFTESVAAYEKIEGKEFKFKTQFNHLHSLYEIGNHDAFILSAESFLKHPIAKADEINTIRFEMAEIYFCKAHAPENEKNKKELLKEALVQYTQVMQTKFADLTLLPQAQIYAFLEEYPKAASLYVLLAHKDLPKKEDYLFQAGCMQLNSDRAAAIITFGIIAEMNGKSAPKAAFNHLNLLFQEKRYKDFILAQDKFMQHIPKEKLPLMQYYLGKAQLQMHDYERAIEPLKLSLSSKNLDRTQEKSALIALIVCAKETEDLSLFDKTLSHLKAEFPSDAETSQTLLMHAQLCRDKKEWAKARADFAQLLESAPNHPQRQEILYDNALTLIQEGKGQEGADAYEAFLREYPETTHKATVLRHVVSARLDVVKAASQDTLKIKQEQLLTSLQHALKEKKIFSSTEKQKMRYLVGKTQFELGSYDEAIAELSEYVKDFSKDPSLADAYLLIAYSHQMGSSDEIHFCLNAEKALSLNPDFQGAIDLHLTLYNIYLGMAGNAHEDEKKEMIAKAASHLFLSLDKPINKENQRWLAGYYFEQYQNGQEEAVDRAAIVLERLLDIQENSFSLTINAHSLEVEGEAMKLSEIYAKTGRTKECAKLLEALVSEQRAHPELDWKYLRMAQFELGKTFLVLGENENALTTFNELISSSSHISSFFAMAAQVEKAKLEFAMLDELDRHEESQSVMAICDALKEIEIKRKMYSEPLHLEAALCYIDIKTELAASDQKNERKLLLLERMKDNFSNAEDPLVSQYLAAASQFPDKERIYKQYLAYVDAELLLLNGKQSEAELIFNQLLGESPGATLAARIRKSTESEGSNL